METERKNLEKRNDEIKINVKKMDKHLIKITLIILLSYIFFSFAFIRNKIFINNLNKNMNITNLIKSEKNSKVIDCVLVKNLFINRTHPFDFENELLFFTNLISCKIPFSFIRFADGENLIMKGQRINSPDKWDWNPNNKKFQDSLIKSVSICQKDYSFIGIPCKNWIHISKSILSFSKCSSAKYMTYSTLFVNKNYPIFKDWITSFINTSNRWKIILVANWIINKNITWAYKFFPVPDHVVENYDNYSISLLSELSHQAKQNDLIFFISAGPAANIIISYLAEINNNNIYIDFGSSIEFITKGYSTRDYAHNGKTSNFSCEPFFIQNNTLIYMK